MDQTKRLKILYRRFIEDQCHKEEVLELLSLLRSEKNIKAIGTIDEEAWAKLKNHPELAAQHHRQLKGRILSGIRKQKTTPQPWINPVRIAASISLLLLAGVAGYYFFGTNPVSHFAKQIRETKSGQKATVLLSDGTVVRLNAESRLDYPEVFNGSTREVILSGEAFFEVTHDPLKPFTVITGDIKTTVLGTSFNIQAFQDTNIAVTLATGKVRVSSANTAVDPLELNPGFQAIYAPSQKRLTRHAVHTGDYIAWKAGVILFNNASEREVLDRLSRWYGVSFKTEGEQSAPWDIQARYKDKSLEFILNSLQYSLGFDYRIEGRKVIIIYK